MSAIQSLPTLPCAHAHTRTLDLLAFTWEQSLCAVAGGRCRQLFLSERACQLSFPFHREVQNVAAHGALCGQPAPSSSWNLRRMPWSPGPCLLNHNWLVALFLFCFEILVAIIEDCVINLVNRTSGEMLTLQTKSGL